MVRVVMGDILGLTFWSQSIIYIDGHLFDILAS